MDAEGWDKFVLVPQVVSFQIRKRNLWKLCRVQSEEVEITCPAFAFVFNSKIILMYVGKLVWKKDKIYVSKRTYLINSILLTIH